MNTSTDTLAKRRYRLAIAHDYLNQLGGAERVVAVMRQMFPEAPVYTLFYDNQKMWPEMKDATIVPSFLQRFPWVIGHFKLFFWLYPFVASSVTIEDYDVVLSSSSAYAKGFRVRKNAHGQKPIHICYCHTPMRFAWDFERYIENTTSNTTLRTMAKQLVPLLKWWDKRTAKTVDVFIANSSIVQERIRNVYGREARVIHPPVTMRVQPPAEPQDYFLVVSRLVAYKRIDLAVQACTMAGLRLLVVGEGPDKARLQALAGPSVEFVGWQDEDAVTNYMRECLAFIFPGEEDFGITPVEVNSLGRPVVAYKAGGALDTVIEGVNGTFFKEQTPESLVTALHAVHSRQWNPEAIVFAARRFERDLFVQRIMSVIDECLKTRPRDAAQQPALLPVREGASL